MQLFDDDSVLFAVFLFFPLPQKSAAATVCPFLNHLCKLYTISLVSISLSSTCKLSLSLDRVYSVSIALMDNNYVSRWMHNDLQVALVGTKVDLTYSYEVQYMMRALFNFWSNF